MYGLVRLGPYMAMGWSAKRGKIPSKLMFNQKRDLKFKIFSMLKCCLNEGRYLKEYDHTFESEEGYHLDMSKMCV